MNLTLKIENFYEDEAEPVITRVEVTVPDPPCPGVESDAYQEWSQEYIWNETGTGQEKGNAAYFVECVQSDVPWMIGRTWEFL